MLRISGVLLIAGALIVPVALTATPAPGSCPSDSKLLNGGPTSVYGEGAGTWWGLVTSGLQAAGFNTEEQQVAYLNQIFGTNLPDLDALQAFNIQLVADNWDTNGNGHICAFELRGRRAYTGDPNINLTYFGISDDRVQ